MSDKIMDILNDMVAEGHFEKVVSKSELLYDRKIWNSDILTQGGFSYFYPEPNLVFDNADKLELKKRYRVSCTYKDEHTKLLKYKIKKADGEVFSIAAKTQAEAREVIDQIFGKGKYSVSIMLGV